MGIHDLVAEMENASTIATSEESMLPNVERRVMEEEDGGEAPPDTCCETEALAAQATQRYSPRLAFSMVAVHLWFLYSFMYLPFIRWQTWIWSLFLWIWAGFGVTGGAHRLWSHRSFQANLLLRIVLMLGCSISGMVNYPIFEWAKDHRIHHKFTDTNGDPYNASRGFFFSHMTWTFTTRHPEVRKHRRTVHVSDNTNDPVVAFERKYHFPLLLLGCFVFPTIVPVMFWNECRSNALAAAVIRWIFEMHAIFSINSFAHLYGSRPFNKSIMARQNFWVAFFIMGEGWHNYHHVFPWDYRASEYGFFDATKHLVRLSERIGWATNLKTASPSLVKRVAARYGDGTHPDWAERAPEVPVEAAVDPTIVDFLPLSIRRRNKE